MSDKLENRKIFLLAGADTGLLDRLSELIRQQVTGATVWTAQDGMEAWGKIENMPPHVFISCPHLAKFDEIRIAHNVIADQKYRSTSMIFLRELPDENLFVEEIVTGRVQFLNDTVNAKQFLAAIAKALNDVSSRESTEFHLKFLATGDRLLNKGDKAQYVYLLRKGRMKAFSEQDGKEIVLGEIDTGEFVGEMAYINGEPRSANVAALTDCELIEIPIDHLDSVLFRKPSWSKALMITLSKRVKRANTQKSN